MYLMKHNLALPPLFNDFLEQHLLAITSVQQ